MYVTRWHALEWLAYWTVEDRLPVRQEFTGKSLHKGPCFYLEQESLTSLHSTG